VGRIDGDADTLGQARGRPRIGGRPTWLWWFRRRRAGGPARRQSGWSGGARGGVLRVRGRSSRPSREDSPGADSSRSGAWARPSGTSPNDATPPWAQRSHRCTDSPEAGAWSAPVASTECGPAGCSAATRPSCTNGWARACRSVRARQVPTARSQRLWPPLDPAPLRQQNRSNLTTPGEQQGYGNRWQPLSTALRIRGRMRECVIR